MGSQELISENLNKLIEIQNRIYYNICDFFMYKNFIKKFISFILAAFMMLSLFSCTNNEQDKNISNEYNNIIETLYDVRQALGEKENGDASTKDNEDANDASKRRNIQGSNAWASKFKYINDYFVLDDLSNVANISQFEFNDYEKYKLSHNNFIVELSKESSPVKRYFKNNKLQLPNYITVDAVSYIYNLYISYLRAKLEEEYLSPMLLKLTHEMLDESKIIYEALKDSSLAEAAKRNVLFFTMALSLQEDCIPEEYIEIQFEFENALIKEGSTSAPSTLTLIPRDYSSLKPTGHYTWSETLSKYYRAITWYRLMSLPQDRDDFIASAFLLSLAEDNIVSNYYDIIVSFSSFLCGVNDDLTCFDYKKIIKELYESVEAEKENEDSADDETIPRDSVIKEILENNNISNQKRREDVQIADESIEKYKVLIENEKLLDEFKEKIRNVDTKKHRFISYDYFDIDTVFGSSEVEKGLKTFRFIPKAFSIDDYIFNMLIEEAVYKRKIPNVLDIASVLGSADAENILRFDNEGLFFGYFDNMFTLRRELYETNSSGDLNVHKKIATSSVSSEKIGTTNERYDKFIDSGGIAAENLLYYLFSALRALLYKKPDVSPKFMNSSTWENKDLECFCGAYAQFKNDFAIGIKEKEDVADTKLNTWLVDDMGYVETEPASFERFYNLSYIIKNGLEKFNLLDEKEDENLNKLMKLSNTFLECVKKEQQSTALKADEIEAIRNFGETISYFEENLKDYIISIGDKKISRDKYEISLVTNIGTLPFSSSTLNVRQVALGPMSDIYVAVVINGELKIAVGSAYSLYQFETDKNQKLSNIDWKNLLDTFENHENLVYEIPTQANSIVNKIEIKKPHWSKEYTYTK